MTWNVCGDARCPMGADPAGLADQVARRVAATEVGGRQVKINAVLLQEVCSGHVDRLRSAGGLRSWTWAFTPERANGGTDLKCSNDQGKLGVAVGAESPLSEVQETRLPSPERHGRSMVCGTVGAWQTRLCSVQLSTGRWDDDPRGRWRVKQVGALAEQAGENRVIIGGDFSERPESRVLDPLYRDLAECDQGPGQSRTGAMTSLDARGAPVAKTDYLFISKTAGASCGVPPSPVRASDHHPLAAAVRFR
jgi:endonuclease/exonuclease/phosphatase family metal-dependent hydrolase